jgi:hypothetical protein
MRILANTRFGDGKGGFTMARVRREQDLFDWAEIEDMGDLKRLKMVLDVIPDEKLIDVLEKERKGRRDDYPVWVIWNTLLGGIVYGHPTVESLRRELLRNPTLRRVCGMRAFEGTDDVPTKDAYSRFLKKLVKHRKMIEGIIDELVELIRVEVPELGRDVAGDATAVSTWARGKRDPGESADPDADWGVKERMVEKEDGGLYRTVKKWFGYKLHLLVDATYEIPVAWRVTRASRSEVVEIPELVNEFRGRHPEVRTEHLIYDKACDSGEFIRGMWKEHEIKAVVSMRDMTKDDEREWIVEGTGNIVTNERGEVYCYTEGGERRQLAYCGFEAKRGTHKYRCPSESYGFVCKDRDICGSSGYGRQVRVRCEDDWRKFPPVARGTYKWERLYKKRTSAERVNSRLKKQLGLDDIFLRRKGKMEVRIGLSIVVLLCLGLAQVRGKKKEWRSLTRVAA